jgi:hypothetical protein
VLETISILGAAQRHRWSLTRQRNGRLVLTVMDFSWVDAEPASASATGTAQA